MEISNLEKIEEFESKINYSFSDKNLLIKALTHTSYAYENKTESYERLEYLGDSILEFISSKYLFNNYSNFFPPNFILRIITSLNEFI